MHASHSVAVAPPVGARAPLTGVLWQPAQVGVSGLGRLEAHPAVDGLGAVGAGEDRIEFELGDLRQVVGHPSADGDPAPNRS